MSEKKKNYNVTLKDGSGIILELSQEAFDFINWSIFGIKHLVDTRMVCGNDCINCELENFCGNHNFSDIVDIKPFSEKTKDYVFKLKNGHSIVHDLTDVERRVFSYCHDDERYVCSYIMENCKNCKFKADMDDSCVVLKGFSTDQIDAIYERDDRMIVKAGIDHDVDIKNLESKLVKDDIFRKYAGFNGDRKKEETERSKIKNGDLIKVKIKVEEKETFNSEVIFQGIQFRSIEDMKALAEALDLIDRNCGVKQMGITLKKPFYLCGDIDLSELSDEGPESVIKHIVEELR